MIKAFLISNNKVIRAQNKLRKHGAEGFFIDRTGRKSGTVMTPGVLEKAQNLLDNEYSKKEVAEELGVKYDTFRKTINDGRLKAKESSESTTNKSTRTFVNAAAANGMGTAQATFSPGCLNNSSCPVPGTGHGDCYRRSQSN